MDRPPPLDPDNPLAFKPVPVRARHDGWTPERQYRFIDALSRIGLVKAAAEAVGKSPKSAYRLRDRDDAASFRRAWDAALAMGQGMALDCAIERATDGVPEPVFYRGKQIGVRRRYDNSLLRAALSTMDRMAARHGRAKHDRLEYNFRAAK
ncbi:hypothetical protein [Parasphingopyxis marina]|uniref:Uncharacterized protein n=1 Tax=Parasphingopyxis marina TaxID=2761622 RepID=A0A842I1Q5_9SPHN|nr:hypothetical protein [Parasphingopyxis marina]MBC2778150.1 hypothetical protein [Parasphingopyxis marina]